MAQILVGPHRYDTRDAANTLGSLAAWWDHVAHGRDPALLAPFRDEQWNVLRDALAPDTHAADATPDDLARMIRRTALDGNDVEGVLAASLSLLGRGWQALRDAGAMPATVTGAVVQLNVGGGGVPKRPVARADIDHGGVVGDQQAARQHHGRPWQALSLWSAEVIDALAADGHPIGYGRAGENITVRGLPWAEVRPGVRLLVGSALAEVTTYAIPCAKNAGWFSDRDFGRIHHGQGPVSRVYASVLEPGQVSTGDPVVLEP